MPADALLYHFLTKELESLLCGARIEKITAPEPDEVFLFLRKNRQNYCLLLSAGAHCRVHITNIVKETPLSPSAFCMNLRKNIGGGIIQSIKQEPFERILYIDILFKNELGVRVDKRLICEIMGKSGNIILCDMDGRIIECLKHIPLDVSAKRQLFPGLKYQIPVLEKLSPLDEERILQLKFDSDPHDTILKNIKGLSPACVAEAVFNAGAYDTSPEVKQRIAAALKRLFTDPISPCILKPNSDESNEFKKDSGRQASESSTGLGRNNGRQQKNDFFVRRFNSLSGSYVFFDTISATLDSFFAQTDASARLRGKARSLIITAKNAQKRAEKRLADLYMRQNESMDFEKDRLFGELITTNIYKIKSGMTMLLADDYYSGGSAEIPLDPVISPAANAQKFYKKYAKKKRTLIATQQQIQKTEAEKSALAQILYSLDNIESAAEIKDIHRELAALGFIKPENKQKNGNKNKERSDKAIKEKSSGEKLSAPRKTEIDGFLVLIGKNNIQNDRLVKNAAGSDIWLHAKDVHGSHVIIQSEHRTVPESVITAAASLAAYYSAAKNADKTEVDYTMIKYVSKPNGAPPGRVVYTHQKTIMTAPKDIP